MIQLARGTNEFAAFLTPAQGNDNKLTQWIAAVRTAGLPLPPPAQLLQRPRTRPRRRERRPLIRPHHNGRTEGGNTRTEKIMRQMHGRTGLDLLRHRIHLH
ncbi:IS transposase [Streptomyces bottropensis ATCC 25435]|jgi:transposase|uniref:IS transposase n=1 Tax=Streptomyces bottropensis ATCC 25435 TaxID=1054862 RepID=M3FVN7_9ACTN|nr:IS transposase [Streptomyces bottropensis ATCC 25435]